MATTGTAVSLTSVDAAQLLVQPLQNTALALDTRVTTTFKSTQTSTTLPLLTSDPQAGWVGEGQIIPASDIGTAALRITPKAAKAYVVVSNELANDSSPDAQSVVGDALVRSLSQVIDKALFGPASADPLVPAGLRSIDPALLTTYTIDPADAEPGAAGLFNDLDAFTEAVGWAAQHGVEVTAFVTDPFTATQLKTLKVSDGSRVPLLQPDPAVAAGALIAGTPLLTSPYVEQGVVWAIPAAVITTVLRQDADVELSEHAAFQLDSVAVRGTVRLAWGFTMPRAIVKIDATGATAPAMQAKRAAAKKS